MIREILGTIIMINMLLIIWILGIKYIKLIEDAIIELNKIGRDKND